MNEVVDALEQVALLPLQEGYDNSQPARIGLTETVEVSGRVLCLDVTEQVVEEAIKEGASSIVTPPSADISQTGKNIRRELCAAHCA